MNDGQDCGGSIYPGRGEKKELIAIRKEREVKQVRRGGLRISEMEGASERARGKVGWGATKQTERDGSQRQIEKKVGGSGGSRRDIQYLLLPSQELLFLLGMQRRYFKCTHHP